MDIFGDYIENIEVALKHYLIPGRDGMYRLHLEKNIFVSMESKVMCVDIRKWFVQKIDVCLKPSKRGVALIFTCNINEDIPY